MIIDQAREFDLLVDAFEDSGGDRSVFQDDSGAFLLVNKDKVVGINQIDGVEIKTEEIDNGVRAQIIIKKGRKLNKPLHLCFGITHQEGLQQIESEFILEEGAEAEVKAHCSFPRAQRVVHEMDSIIKLGPNSSLKYEEVHYHGSDAGIEVIPKARAILEEGSYFYTEFKLIKGRVGRLDIDFQVELADNAVTEMISKVYGKKNDRIRIKETLNLNGKSSRGLAKTRVFASDNTTSEVIAEAYGNAPYVKGHVDCVEAVKGEAEVSAIPIIKVNNDLAELSHEASIGRINQKQLETLLARGLSEDEATDLIVNGMLK